MILIKIGNSKILQVWDFYCHFYILAIFGSCIMLKHCTISALGRFDQFPHDQLFKKNNLCYLQTRCHMARSNHFNHLRNFRHWKPFNHIHHNTFENKRKQTGSTKIQVRFTSISFVRLFCI